MKLRKRILVIFILVIDRPSVAYLNKQCWLLDFFLIDVWRGDNFAKGWWGLTYCIWIVFLKELSHHVVAWVWVFNGSSWIRSFKDSRQIILDFWGYYARVFLIESFHFFQKLASFKELFLVFLQVLWLLTSWSDARSLSLHTLFFLFFVCLDHFTACHLAEATF